MWTTALEVSPRGASWDRRTDPHRNGLEEHMQEMRRLLIAKGAISRYWIFSMDGEWIESPAIDSDRPAEPGATVATGGSEEASSRSSEVLEKSQNTLAIR